MDSNVSSLAAWSYALAAVANGLLFVYLAARWRGAGLVRRVLATTVGLSALWGALVLGYCLSGQPAWLAAGSIADFLRVAGSYAFLLTAMRLSQQATSDGGRTHRASLSAAAAAVVVVGLAAHLMILLDIRDLGNPQRLWLLDSLAAAVFGLVLVEQLLRNASADSLWSVKPLCLGLGGAYLFDIYVYSDGLLFNHVDPDVFSVRGFVYAMVVPLVALSAIRSHQGTPTIVLSRRVVFHSAALVGSGAYLLVMASAGYYVRFFGGDWGRAFQLVLLFAALLFLGMAAFSGSARAKLRVLVSKHFFRYRYDYREEWLRFTNALSAHGAPQEMEQRVIRGLADLVESPGGALWLRDGSEKLFTQAACWNMAPTTNEEDAAGALCGFLVESGWVINLEEFRSSPTRYGSLVLPVWLSAIPSAWLIVPLASGDELMGFVVLATARTQVDVNWEVNDLLKTAGRQAASFVGQMRASEALLEARKFDAFNRMSAFVVHDLKNIVAQLSLMLRNAERHSGNPEFQRDMLMTVEHSVERMKQLMMQLREGTTPVDAARGVDLAEIVRRIARSKAPQERPIELLVNDSVVAKGHPDRLERVIGHVVQNALDATDAGGRIWIKLERGGGQAMVEIGDSGHGMTPEFVRERLFKPFQTTKATGMGIGAYESYQYIQELGGRILVDSTPEVGTRVRLLLPLFEGGKAAMNESRVAA